MSPTSSRVDRALVPTAPGGRHPPGKPVDPRDVNSIPRSRLAVPQRPPGRVRDPVAVPLQPPGPVGAEDRWTVERSIPANSAAALTVAPLTRDSRTRDCWGVSCGPLDCEVFRRILLRSRGSAQAAGASTVGGGELTFSCLKSGSKPRRDRPLTPRDPLRGPERAARGLWRGPGGGSRPPGATPRSGSNRELEGTPFLSVFSGDCEFDSGRTRHAHDDQAFYGSATSVTSRTPPRTSQRQASGLTSSSTSMS